ncbi:hypothetical protein K439DRAFT_1617330 [Ramaria rubella]|nr:hypothetical protein K439DRAFT_1617330 [Ramaria rubella]
MEELIIDWVEKYERWYYHYEEKHLPACLFYVHALLHFSTCICLCGLAWTAWAFPMECYCGKLSASHLHPYATLAVYMKRTAQCSQLKVCYSWVWEPLATDPADGDPMIHEQIYPESNISPKMAQYFAAAYGCCGRDVQQIFPETVVSWGKVRIANDGDKICAAVAVSAAQAVTSHDASFVWSDLLVKNPCLRRGEPTEHIQKFSGQLQYILEVNMPRSNALGITEPRHHLLALVKPCMTGNKDTTAISAVIGRIKCGNKWVIIDHSRDLAHMVFVDPEPEEE